MKLIIFAILFYIPVLCAGEKLPDFKGMQFSVSVPSGYKIISSANGGHDASDGSVPFFTAMNEKNHVIMGFFDSSLIVRQEEVPAVIELVKKILTTPTSRIVKSGMVDNGKGGRSWGMVELDDSKATKPHTEHLIMLLTSTDNSLLRILFGGPHTDATELGNEVNELMAKFEEQEKVKTPNQAPEPTATAVTPDASASATPPAPESLP